MNLKKRSAAPEETDASGTPEKAGGKRPVVVYIMVLFIVAFILMAVSFLMHQRSNSEAIGKLNDSVTALKEVQATQDENIRLQEELSDAQKENDALRAELDEASGAAAKAEAAGNRADALLALYTLQQQYATGDYDGCKKTVADMEDKGLDKLLPAAAGADGVTSPAQRYLQYREALADK